MGVTLKILSIDQSSVRTGYAIFNGTDLIKWGVLDFHKEKDIEVRLLGMCKDIDAMISKMKPALVVFEDVSLRTSVKTLIILARIQGCIMQSCYTRGIQFMIYAPTTWRRICEFSQNNKIQRKELKEQAIAFVKNGFGIRVGDDCAEAICIGLAHLKSSGELPELPNKNNMMGTENK